MHGVLMLWQIGDVACQIYAAKHDHVEKGLRPHKLSLEQARHFYDRRRSKPQKQYEWHTHAADY